MNKLLEQRWEWINNRSKEIGADYFDIKLEWVNEDVMLEAQSYALPHHYSHWSHGQIYEYQKINGKLGGSKVYELIFNSENPCYAFMLDTNSDSANTLVMCHIIGHSFMFKNNYLFEKSDRQMVYRSAERATRIDDYMNTYGIEAVEHTLNMALAMDKNIDWDKGLYRDLHSGQRIKEKEISKDEFSDILGENKKNEQAKVSFPPHPEYDLLWFSINYSKLEDWQKDIFSIVREESFYFYPQSLTKILHEGCSCLFQAELLSDMPRELLSEQEYLDTLKLHERVVQPGSDPTNINPYFLGFKILESIRKNFKEDSFKKVLEICKNEDDISFIRNYLTQDIVDELKLFTYIYVDAPDGSEFVKVKSTTAKDVIESLISKMYNYRVPQIAITKYTNEYVCLEHKTTHIGTLDENHIERVLKYFFDIWQRNVYLSTMDETDHEVTYKQGKEGFVRVTNYS